MANTRNLEERFEGCLLGLAVGDALGGKFEAQSAEAIRNRFPSAADLIAYPQDELWYTDDTQMMIGIGEALTECGEIIEEVLCRAFVANYTPSRGYGRGARMVLEAMEEGRDHRAVAAEYFPGGSFGNGAAMRVAPVGLLFRDAPDVCGNRRGDLHCRRTSTRSASRGHNSSRWRSPTLPAGSSSITPRSLPTYWPRVSRTNFGPNCRRRRVFGPLTTLPCWATGSRRYTRCRRPSPASP